MTITQKNDKTSPAFELKGSALTLMVLYLFTADHDRLNAQLQKKFAVTAGFFRNAPLLIDGCNLPVAGAEVELSSLLVQLRTLGLVPVALRGGSPELQKQALTAGLGLLPALRGEAAPSETPEPIAPFDEPLPPLGAEEKILPPDTKPSHLQSLATATKVVTRTIRSGQRIVAPTGDLIVFGAVNPGAEILAAGNIHVYGPLRGRALAGIHGDSSVRICALQFSPELVAVAGDYLLHDEIDTAQLDGAVVVTIVDEKLKIETIGTFAPSHV